MKILVVTILVSSCLLLAICRAETSTSHIGDKIITTLKTSNNNNNNNTSSSNANTSNVVVVSTATSTTATNSVGTSTTPVASKINKSITSAESTTYYPIITQQVQPQTRYIPLHYTYKHYYVPQVSPYQYQYHPQQQQQQYQQPQHHQQQLAAAASQITPTTVLLLAQPSSYIPQALYTAAAHQLVNYYHHNPQARVALLQHYQNQHPNPVPQASYVNYQMVAAPQTTQYQLVAPPTAVAYANQPSAAASAVTYDQTPQFRATQATNFHGGAQPMPLNLIAQMAATAAQHHSYSSFNGGHGGGGASAAISHTPIQAYSPATVQASHHQHHLHHQQQPQHQPPTSAYAQAETSYYGGQVDGGATRGHYYAAAAPSNVAEHGQHHLNTNEYVVQDREIPSSSNYNPTYVYRNQFTKG